jgi:hypothetical protein
MYRLEVEAEKTKEGPTVSNKTPLPVAHDVRKPNTYVFSVFPFFFFHFRPSCSNLLRRRFFTGTRLSNSYITGPMTRRRTSLVRERFNRGWPSYSPLVRLSLQPKAARPALAVWRRPSQIPITLPPRNLSLWLLLRGPQVMGLGTAYPTSKPATVRIAILLGNFLGTMNASHQW